jgi:hypothetical protein
MTLCVSIDNSRTEEQQQSRATSRYRCLTTYPAHAVALWMMQAQMTGFGLLNTTCGQLPPAPMIRVVAEGRCSCGSFPQQRGGGGSWSDGWCHH